MDTERMIRELRYLQKKHEDDKVCTFGTVWSDVCRDVANRLDELLKELEDLKSKKGGNK